MDIYKAGLIVLIYCVVLTFLTIAYFLGMLTLGIYVGILSGVVFMLGSWAGYLLST